MQQAMEKKKVHKVSKRQNKVVIIKRHNCVHKNYF